MLEKSFMNALLVQIFLIFQETWNNTWRFTRGWSHMNVWIGINLLWGLVKSNKINLPTLEINLQCVFPCEKSFNHSVSFKDHLKTHTGRSPVHVFSEKNTTFSQYNNLKQHKVIHFRDKPFKCSSCEKSFSQSGNLREHIRTHTGEMPYACRQCQKHLFSFVQSETLQIG